jgi:hypothetical protein
MTLNLAQRRYTHADSDYAWHVNRRFDFPVIVVEDLDKGGASVTNNLEAVASQVVDESGHDLADLGKNFLMVYRDSMGIYEGVELADKGGLSVRSLSSPLTGKEIRREDPAVACAIGKWEGLLP